MNPPGALGHVTVAASFGLLLVFAVLNVDRPGLLLFAVGVLLNALVVIANGGMPITRQAVIRSDQASTLPALDAGEGGAKHHLANDDSVLVILGDVTGVPAPIGAAVSVGDLVLYAGIGVVRRGVDAAVGEGASAHVACAEREQRHRAQHHDPGAQHDPCAGDGQDHTLELTDDRTVRTSHRGDTLIEQRLLRDRDLRRPDQEPWLDRPPQPGDEPLDDDEVPEQDADGRHGRASERRDGVCDDREDGGDSSDPRDDAREVADDPGGVPSVVPAIATATRYASTRKTCAPIVNTRTTATATSNRTRWTRVRRGSQVKRVPIVPAVQSAPARVAPMSTPRSTMMDDVPDGDPIGKVGPPDLGPGEIPPPNVVGTVGGEAAVVARRQAIRRRELAAEARLERPLVPRIRRVPQAVERGDAHADHDPDDHTDRQDPHDASRPRPQQLRTEQPDQRRAPRPA